MPTSVRHPDARSVTFRTRFFCVVQSPEPRAQSVQLLLGFEEFQLLYKYQNVLAAASDLSSGRISAAAWKNRSALGARFCAIKL